jgi:hypothetical protein
MSPFSDSQYASKRQQPGTLTSLGGRLPCSEVFGFHFAFLLVWVISAVLLLGAAFVAGYGFRKGWERAAPRQRPQASGETPIS